jgi:hypothetical protein
MKSSTPPIGLIALAALPFVIYFLPEWVVNTLIGLIFALGFVAAIGGYLFRRKWKREAAAAQSKQPSP